VLQGVAAHSSALPPLASEAVFFGTTATPATPATPATWY